MCVIAIPLVGTHWVLEGDTGSENYGGTEGGTKHHSTHRCDKE